MSKAPVKPADDDKEAGAEQPEPSTTTENEAAQGSNDEPKRQQRPTAANRRKAMQDAADGLKQASARDNLPDDLDGLKDYTLAKMNLADSLGAKVEKLEAELRDAAPKLKNYDKMAASVEREIAASASRWRIVEGSVNEGSSDDGVDDTALWVFPHGDLNSRGPAIFATCKTTYAEDGRPLMGTIETAIMRDNVYVVEEKGFYRLKVTNGS